MLRIFGIVVACLLIPVSLSAQVRQSGTVTRGHAAMWITENVIGDAGTAAAGNLTSLGVTASGPGICQNSDVITKPYQRLCFNVNTSTGGAITLDALGGATPGPLSFIINGSTLTTVSAVPPITGGNTVCFNSSSGDITNCAETGSGSVVRRVSPSISGATITSPAITGGTITANAITNSSGNFTSLLLNGVPVSTSSDSYWTNAGGNISYNAGTVSAFRLNGTFDIRYYGALCDGSTDDSTAFNSARLAAQGAGGGTVIVPPNATCIINSNTALIFTAGAGNTLQGYGPASIIKAKNSAALTNMVGVSNATTGTFTLKDITIDGNCSGGGTTTTGAYLLTLDARAWVENAAIQNGCPIGVVFGSNGSGTTILNSRITGNQGTGMYNIGSPCPANVRVIGSYFSDNYKPSPIGDSTAINACTMNWVISGNTFVNNLNITGGQVALTDNLDGSTALNTVFSNNIIYQNATVVGENTFGLEIDGSSIVVTGNRIIGTTQAGINLEGLSQNVLVSGNEISSGGNGIQTIQSGGGNVTNSTFQGNTIVSATAGIGISLDNPSPANVNMVVKDNIIAPGIATAITGVENASIISGNSRGNWISFSPTVSTQGGNFSTLGSVISAYTKEGETGKFNIRIPITTIGGSASGFLSVTLPWVVTNNCTLNGMNIVANKTISGYAGIGGTVIAAYYYDGTSPWTSNGDTILMNGVCQIN